MKRVDISQADDVPPSAQVEENVEDEELKI